MLYQDLQNKLDPKKGENNENKKKNAEDICKLIIWKIKIL